MTDLLPQGLMANTLNYSQPRILREHRADGAVPILHVSSLIHSGSNNFFCPREFVLRHHERHGASMGGLPPKFALLYATGHFLGDYVVQEFLRRSVGYAKYAWGNWSCACGDTYIERETLPQNRTCDNCGMPVDRYIEVDLFNPAHTVIGHADLIFCVNDVYYVYEFKSIQRADIVFKEINEPLGDHLLQASSYYYMLKAESKKVDPNIRFVYIDRSMTGLYTEYPYREVASRPISISRLTKIYKRAELAIAAVDSAALPIRRCKSPFTTRAKDCACAVSCFNRESKYLRPTKPTRSD